MWCDPRRDILSFLPCTIIYNQVIKHSTYLSKRHLRCRHYSASYHACQCTSDGRCSEWNYYVDSILHSLFSDFVTSIITSYISHARSQWVIMNNYKLLITIKFPIWSISKYPPNSFPQSFLLIVIFFIFIQLFANMLINFCPELFQFSLTHFNSFDLYSHKGLFPLSN